MPTPLPNLCNNDNNNNIDNNNQSPEEADADGTIPLENEEYPDDNDEEDDDTGVSRQGTHSTLQINAQITPTAETTPVDAQASVPPTIPNPTRTRQHNRHHSSNYTHLLPRHAGQHFCIGA